MKKKLVTMMLTAALAVSVITGCGGDEEAAPSRAAQTEDAAEEPAEEAEEPAEEDVQEGDTEEASDESADSSASNGEFTLLDVDENMIDVGAYGMDSDGLELVFSMFTGPDNNKYVSLFGFDNNSNNGYVICGQYEATTEVDEDEDEWTYFDVTDVYSGQHFNLGVIERPETEEVAFFDKEGNVVQGKFLTNAETINYMGSAVALLSGDSEE